jgi:histidine triad (HIT) family protein
MYGQRHVEKQRESRMIRFARLLAIFCLPISMHASALPQAGDGYGNAYPPDEVFAKISRHEPPYNRQMVAYEDKDVMVFADHAPWSVGHMLVIARNSRARSLIDMPPETLAKMMAIARRVMIAQRDGLGATGAAVFISNGSVQSVPHLHIHVAPHYKGQPSPLPERASKRVPDSDLIAPTAKIAKAMKTPS